MRYNSNVTTFALLAGFALALALSPPASRRAAAQGALENKRPRKETGKKPAENPAEKPAEKEKPFVVSAPKPKEVVRKPSTFVLSVETKPARAGVYVNNRYRGETDARGTLALTLKPGVHTVSVRKQDYVPEERPVNMGRARKERFELDPITYTLTVTTDPPGADVYLDGPRAGSTNRSGIISISRVPRGKHTLTVRAEGHLPDIRDLNVTGDARLPVIRLDPDPVRVGVAEMRRLTNAGDIEGAFAVYRGLPAVRLGDQPVRAALGEAIARLDIASQSYFGSLGPDGLRVEPGEAWVMMRLYEQASALRPGVAALEAMGGYWEAKFYDLSAASETDAARGAEARRRVRTGLARAARPAMRFGWLYYDAGWCYYRLREFDAAEQSFRAAAGALRNNAWLGYALARLHIERAEAEADSSRKRRHLTAAVAESSAALTSDQRLAHAYAARAVARSKLSKHKEAVADGLAATGLGPRSAYAHYALGLAYYGRKKYPEARRALEFAVTATEDRLDRATHRFASAMLEARRR